MVQWFLGDSTIGPVIWSHFDLYKTMFIPIQYIQFYREQELQYLWSIYVIYLFNELIYKEL